MEKRKDLKKYYIKKEVIYTVYDNKNYDLPVAQFDSLEELHSFINNKIHNITFNSLKNTISKCYNILDRYYIVKDKLEA